MRSETGRQLAFLDGWRGLAIAFVLVGHFATDAIRPGLSGLGVDLFFVLSGRLMAEILFVRRAPLGTFVLRRFSRVYPALCVFVILTTILFSQTHLRHGLAAVATALTFTANYAMIYGHPIGLLDHLWSLCVEEHSYAVLAVVAALVGRETRGCIVVLAALGLAAMTNGIVRAALTDTWYPDVAWRSDVQAAPLFIAGAFHLAAREARWAERGWISPVCLVLGIAVKLYATCVLVQFGLGTLLLALSVATVDRAFARFRRMLEPEPLRQIGLWSFSLYLWQQPFYKLAHDEVAATGPLLLGALCAGIASYYLVEAPARAIINERWAWLVHRPPAKPA